MSVCSSWRYHVGHQVGRSSISRYEVGEVGAQVMYSVWPGGLLKLTVRNRRGLPKPWRAEIPKGRRDPMSYAIRRERGAIGSV